MDKRLKETLGQNGGIDLVGDTGRAKLPDGSEYELKPLTELYEAAPEADANHDALQLALESTVLEFDHAHGLTDAKVLLAITALGTSPEAPSTDPLVQALQLKLRAVLSLNGFDRQSVRQAARRITKSVQKFTSRGAQRGYLEAIHGHVPHHHHHH